MLTGRDCYRWRRDYLGLRLQLSTQSTGRFWSHKLREGLRLGGLLSCGIEEPWNRVLKPVMMR